MRDYLGAPRVGALLAASALSVFATSALAVKYSVKDLGSMVIQDFNEEGDITGVSNVGLYVPASGAKQTIAEPVGASFCSAHGPSVAGDIVLWCFRTDGGTANFDRTFIYNTKSSQSTEIKSLGNTITTMTSNGFVVTDTAQAWSAATGYISLGKDTSGYPVGYDTVMWSSVGRMSNGEVLFNGALMNNNAPSIDAAYAWQPGGAVRQVLSFAKGFYAGGSAVAVSAKGIIVGTAPNSTRYDGKHFIWLPKWGFFPIPSTFYATGVNDSLRIIGYTYDSTTSTLSGVTWSLLGGVQKLTSLLDASGKGYTITNAMFINTKGQIAAYAQSASDSMTHAVVLTPTP